MNNWQGVVVVQQASAYIRHCNDDISAVCFTQVIICTDRVDPVPRQFGSSAQRLYRAVRPDQQALGPVFIGCIEQDAV